MFRSYLKITLHHRLRARALSVLLACSLMACSNAFNALHSDLTVQPGKQFELGGNQTGAFTVRVRNVGRVPVTILERRADGQQVTRGTFQPGDGQTVRFLAGSAALVANATAQSARLDLTVTGDTNLSMKETPKP